MELSNDPSQNPFMPTARSEKRNTCQEHFFISNWKKIAEKTIINGHHIKSNLLKGSGKTKSPLPNRSSSRKNYAKKN